MRSLRSTLAARVIGLGAVLLLISLAATYALANRILVRHFDRGLEERAAILATLLEQVGERVELHFADEVMPRYSDHVSPEFFQLWIGERVLARSVSLVLTGGELPRPPDRGPVQRWNLSLPDG